MSAGQLRGGRPSPLPPPLSKDSPHWFHSPCCTGGDHDPTTFPEEPQQLSGSAGQCTVEVANDIDGACARRGQYGHIACQAEAAATVGRVQGASLLSRSRRVAPGSPATPPGGAGASSAGACHGRGVHGSSCVQFQVSSRACRERFVSICARAPGTQLQASAAIGTMWYQAPVGENVLEPNMCKPAARGFWGPTGGQLGQPSYGMAGNKGRTGWCMGSLKLRFLARLSICNACPCRPWRQRRMPGSCKRAAPATARCWKEALAPWTPRQGPPCGGWHALHSSPIPLQVCNLPALRRALCRLPV